MTAASRFAACDGRRQRSDATGGATTIALAAIVLGFVAGGASPPWCCHSSRRSTRSRTSTTPGGSGTGRCRATSTGSAALDVHRPPVQWVAQHPPLFYLLLAPLVGPLVDAGHGLGAVQLARIVNIAIGALAVMAVAWATGEVVTGASRRRWMVAAAAIVAPFGALVGTSAAVYNDALATALGALLLGIGARALRRGVDLRLTAAAALTAGAAALTRIALLPTVAVTVGARSPSARSFTGAPRSARRPPDRAPDGGRPGRGGGDRRVVLPPEQRAHRLVRRLSGRRRHAACPPDRTALCSTWSRRPGCGGGCSASCSRGRRRARRVTSSTTGCRSSPSWPWASPASPSWLVERGRRRPSTASSWRCSPGSCSSPSPRTSSTWRTAGASTTATSSRRCSPSACWAPPV